MISFIFEELIIKEYFSDSISNLFREKKVRISMLLLLEIQIVEKQPYSILHQVQRNELEITEELLLTQKKRSLN